MAGIGIHLSMSSPVSSLTASRSSSPEPCVQPDHFYGDASHLPPSPDSDKAYLSPEDDPLAHRGIPVFKPSMAEFADFEGYMNRVECWGRRSGIVKVVPPPEWTAALPEVTGQLAGVKIKSPIEQFMRGRAGLFRQENVEKRKLMSVREWAELCAKDEFRAPGKDQVGVHNGGVQHPQRSRRKKQVKDQDEDKQNAEKDKQDQVKVEQSDVAMASPPNSPSPDPDDSKQDLDSKNTKARNRRIERAGKDASFLESFHPHTHWLPPGTTAADYTPEFCAKLERTFWRNCGLGKPAWYGADTMGSLFLSSTTSWNVASLPSTLSRLLPASTGLPGVNTPYLYFGMWRATFAWHVEDMDLFSINYIHFGAPKFWYAVPQARAGALENTMRDTSQCPQFLRHKSFLASPTLLAQNAVRPNHLVQHAGEFDSHTTLPSSFNSFSGEFVITYPRGYHAGFNLGLNCAESVNFALDSWLDEGRKAAVCQCVDFSVRIDVDQLLEDRRIEALEQTDPAAAARARALRDGLNIDVELEPAIDEQKPKSRISDPNLDLVPSKRSPRKRKPTAPFEIEPDAKRPRVTSSTPTTYPCCLCVDPSLQGLARVHDLPPAWRELAPAARVHFPPRAEKDNSGSYIHFPSTAGSTSGGKGVWMAHESCALVLPETWVDDIDGERVVFGVDGIVRGRWSLKCSACTRARSKAHGALIQCAKGKCPKAFHVSCAQNGARAGTGIAYTVVRDVEKEVVLLEPVPGTNGGASDADPNAPQGEEPNLRVLKVIKKTEVEALCAQHNPVIVAERRASKAEGLRADILALPPLSRIKIRVSAGVFEVTLVRVHEDRRSIEVLWDTQGEVREFKWGAVMMGQTSLPTTQVPDFPIHQPVANGNAYATNARAVAPVPATAAPDAHGCWTNAARPQNVITIPAPTSSRVSTNAVASTPNQQHQTNSAPGQSQAQPQSQTQTQAHNPYNVFKYQYWPAGYTYPTAGSAPVAGTQSGTTANVSTDTARAAPPYVPMNQYYTGPQPWSSQYYRPATTSTPATYYPAQYSRQNVVQAPPNSSSNNSVAASNTAPTVASNLLATAPPVLQPSAMQVDGQDRVAPDPIANSATAPSLPSIQDSQQPAAPVSVESAPAPPPSSALPTSNPTSPQHSASASMQPDSTIPPASA
ncbi:hypothetical protein B0H12DRAFT_1129888 [Mycena haematopus]|nr:hypothetical protein B0H12DRAFT_1129888 [Mycena haematopus]